jgi:transcription elongation factor GreA
VSPRPAWCSPSATTTTTETETFLLATRERARTASWRSTRRTRRWEALLGAREGETREYTLPNGGTMKVTLIKARPYKA